VITTLTGALGLSAHDSVFWIPLAFSLLLLVTVTALVLLDGVDVGVGCLLMFAPLGLRQTMIRRLNPWRDANELWLFLVIGLFLAVFPGAWTEVFKHLYLPLSLLSLGVILRTISFEFRVRAPGTLQGFFIRTFSWGSWLTAIAHGVLLSRIVASYEVGSSYVLLSIFLAACAVAGYALLGSSALAMQTTGALQHQAILWARGATRWVAAGLVCVAASLAATNTGVFWKWMDVLGGETFSLLWGVLLASFVMLELLLRRMHHPRSAIRVLPFILASLIMTLGLIGLAYSFFPYIVLDTITLWDAAVSAPMLRFALGSTLMIMPVALGFNSWAYRGFFRQIH